MHAGHDMNSLYLLQDLKSRRASSFDRSGGNHDWLDIPPGESVTIAELNGPGIVRHIWMTYWTGTPEWVEERLALRKLLLSVYWDDESSPSIQAPLGDFFGVPFGHRRLFSSAAFEMGPQDGRSMHCWWPMPFKSRARFVITSHCDNPTNLYFYIDYEEAQSLPTGGDIGYFHAQFNRERNTAGWAPQEPGLLDREKANVPGEPPWAPLAWQRKNTDGKDNYVILRAEGRGRYVGCNMGVDITVPQANEWYGEGDDMIFIDGEEWPPSLHGTGTEDYFGGAFCPTQEYCGPYFGLTLYSGDKERKGYKFHGKNAMYRLHVRDPIHFEKSALVTIEHGHANKLTGDWCSTAYWYQTEPHLPMETLSMDQIV